RDSSYPIKLCEEMAKIMNEQKIRRKRLSVDEKSVISMLYHTYLLEKTAGLDLDVWKGEEYLIIYDGTNSSFELSPLYRTIRVKRIENLEDLKNTLYDYREYLQTIGTNLEKEEVAELFADYNISRIVDVGNMPITKIYHHEGMPLFSPLIKWIDIEEEKRPIRKIERKFLISYKSKSI
ncbi:MAG: acyl-CoA reductase, partial [Candidatus Aenigmatarchaeota archaeon]